MRKRQLVFFTESVNKIKKIEVFFCHQFLSSELFSFEIFVFLDSQKGGGVIRTIQTSNYKRIAKRSLPLFANTHFTYTIHGENFLIPSCMHIRGFGKTLNITQQKVKQRNILKYLIFWFRRQITNRRSGYSAQS